MVYFKKEIGDKIMKVLLVNGWPHKNGCTYTALTEIEKELNKEGIELPEQEKITFTNFIR